MTVAKANLSFVCQYFKRTCSLNSIQFHMQASDKGVKNAYIFGPDQMTKMTTKPYMVKSLKFFFSITTELIVLKHGL